MSTRILTPAASLFLEIAHYQMTGGLCCAGVRSDPRTGRPMRDEKPGTWLSRQPESVREVLRDLKSSDIDNVRVPAWI